MLNNSLVPDLILHAC